MRAEALIAQFGWLSDATGDLLRERKIEDELLFASPSLSTPAAAAAAKTRLSV